MRTSLSLALIALLLPALIGTTVNAELVTVEAVNNGTIQPAGPRSGTSGKAFFNIEGSANGNFASFGIADFDFSTSPFLTSLSSISVSLTQSNAGFTSDGAVNFYLASDLSTSIDPGNSPLIYDVNAGEEGVGNQLGTLVQLGTGTFTEVSDGTVDLYQFTISSGNEALILDQFNNQRQLRLVITPTQADVAATWAGFSNTDFNGPTITLDGTAVPEPASAAVLAVLSTAVAGVRWAKRKRV